MMYNFIPISSINNIDEVKAFFNYLYFNENESFNLKKDFNEFIFSYTGVPMYSDEEASFRKALKKQCFKICNATNINMFMLHRDCLKEIEERNKDCTDVAVCIRDEEFVNELTGRIFSFRKNEYFKIVFKDAIGIALQYGVADDEYFYKWDYKEYFRPLESYEADALKYNL